MSKNNIERMKKLIEDKKKLGMKQNNNTEKLNPQMGSQQRPFKSTKRGGFFDK